ncbi:ribose-phosphate pyrophosphokinase [Marivirga harenae]|uniref:ribose-phosphate pyrophosphokinase n=1 Tax=Marivirga harenae TaxID=2010992 RepID=UPI0026DEB127|nr:ribose-phosphate pyrophosphokinase [Marivirga harenae]WKV11338.1 ribose-phosphate pyrophosphokinase [Marivirga harenae]|tara:strand:- start:84813 stop:85739 length:927 start_codon:yes stop_codon:yes gene_type:complete
MSSVKIFSGSTSKYLSERIAMSYGKPLGDVELQKFSDGELSPYFTESIRGHHVFLIQSTFPPADNIMELLLMIDAARRASAYKVTLVVPYFGYARQDRKDKPRVAIGAKMLANIFEAAGADRIVTCDLHAGQIQGFFNIPVDHMDASAIFVPYLQESITPDTIFASPDVGGTARARKYAKHFQLDMVVCDKQRKKANEVASMQVIGDVQDKDVIIFDDLVDTAGTLCKAADMLKEKGAKSVRAIITHPVLSGNAYENIANSQLDELITTDTLPLKQKSDKIKVLSVADMFAKAIRKIHDNESISSLFI